MLRPGNMASTGEITPRPTKMYTSRAGPVLSLAGQAEKEPLIPAAAKRAEQPIQAAMSLAPAAVANPIASARGGHALRCSPLVLSYPARQVAPISSDST